MTEVIGLYSTAAYRLSNGVQLMPFSEAPSSQMTDLYRQRPRGLLFDHSLPISAAVFEVNNCPVSEESPNRWQPDEVERVVHAHVLVSDHSAPAIGVSWIEFADLEMEEATPHVGWGMPRFDAPIRDGMGGSVTEESISKVESFLSLDQATMRVCEVAASRLITARNRLSDGNRALDGCICLEALLTDKDENSENTYKIALRASLLLGTCVEERQAIWAVVKAFYTLRSDTVHGRTKSPRADTVTGGLRICAQVLQKIIDLRQIPDWKKLELGALPRAGI